MSNRNEGSRIRTGNRGSNWTDSLEESLALLIKKHWLALGFTDKAVRNAKHRQEKYADGWGKLIQEYKEIHASENHRKDSAIINRVYKVVRAASKARTMTSRFRQEHDPHSGKLYEILASTLNGIVLQGEPLNSELDQHLLHGRNSGAAVSFISHELSEEDITRNVDRGIADALRIPHDPNCRRSFGSEDGTHSSTRDTSLIDIVEPIPRLGEENARRPPATSPSHSTGAGPSCTNFIGNYFNANECSVGSCVINGNDTVSELERPIPNGGVESRLPTTPSCSANEGIRVASSSAGTPGTYVSASTEARKKRATTYSNTSTMVALERDSLALSQLEYSQREKFYEEVLLAIRELTRCNHDMRDAYYQQLSLLSHMSSVFEKYTQAYIFYVEQTIGKRICTTEYQSRSSSASDSSDDSITSLYRDMEQNQAEQDIQHGQQQSPEREVGEMSHCENSPVDITSNEVDDEHTAMNCRVAFV